MSQLALLVLNLHVSLLNLLVAKLYLEALELDFLCQRVVLAVVAHLVELLLVALYALLSLCYLALLLSDSLLEVCDVALYVLHTCLQACNLVFKVLHFKRQLAAQCALLVDSRESGLKLVEGLQSFLY